MESESKPMEFDKIAAALAKAQAEMTNPPKTKTAVIIHKNGGGRHSYCYADLADVLDHVRGPLTKNGLAVIQIVTPGVLITRLVHESGQMFESTYPLPTVAVDPQSMGSAITYARRYSLCPLLGIAGETDDDAKGATEAETAAAEAEADQKKAEARARIDALKAKGQMVSAYTGKELKPGEEAKPEEDDDLAPMPGPDALAGIAPVLAELMRKDFIAPEELKGYSVKRGHIPAPGMEPAQYPGDYVKKLCQPGNWASVVKHIKGETK
jgi:hypothetical protein